MSDKAILDGAEQVATMLAVNRLRSAAREAASAKALLVAVSVPDLQAVLAEVRRLNRQNLSLDEMLRRTTRNPPVRST